jgi:flagellar basal-body rod protein FlgG
MIESFYSGTAGLTSHQNALDVIANNMSNVNTTGYKAKKQDFSALLAVSEVRPETANSATLLAGSGSRVDSVATDMSNGTVNQTNKSTDYYINGSGFFAVQDNNGNVFYTRDGSFHLSGTGNNLELRNNNGLAVLDSNGRPVTADAAGNTGTPGVFEFANAPGLSSTGSNLFEATALSGAETISALKPEQGKLECSNVDLAEQMAGLITSQRGYQLNSSVVSTADQIENMINQLNQR